MYNTGTVKKRENPLNGGHEMNGSVILTVGEELHLKTGKDRITCAGMPSENTCSIVRRKAGGYQGYAWNLYFPRRTMDITVDGVHLAMESVSPEEIHLRVQ